MGGSRNCRWGHPLLPLPPPLPSSPLLPFLPLARGSGGAPAGSAAEPRPKMDLVHSRAVRKPLVSIILSILKCVFYSRSISSAGVLMPCHNIVHGTELFEGKKSIKMVLPCVQYNHCLHNIHCVPKK